VLNAAERLSDSRQPLVPERVFVAGGGDGAATATAGQGLLGTLIGLLVAEKSGFQLAEGGNGNGHGNGLDEMAERMTREALESMEKAVAARREAADVTDATPLTALRQS